MIPQHCAAKPMKRVLGLVLAMLLALSIGCSSNPKEKPSTVRSEQAYYSSAQAAIKAKNFFLAVEHLQNIETHYPFGKYTAQAQLDLIFAHYESGSYDSAAATANRFVQQHPRHPELDYAYYMRALSNYDINRGFITRVLPTTPSQRSMKPVMTTYQDFRKLISRFPKSKYAADARQRMLYLRNILADHEIQVGRYYLRRGAHLAAVNRGQYVLKHFPDSPSVPDALALATKGYIELEMPELAKEHLALLVDNYPKHPDLDGQQLDYTRQSLRRKRSWLNIISFGLIGDSGQ